MSSPSVFVLTYCPTLEQLYGNLLALNTLRVGFPTSRIVVTDNCSCPEAKAEFIRLSGEHGYTYRELHTELDHSEYLQNTIAEEIGPIAFVDCDVVFWENCEHFLDDYDTSELVIRGRLIPMIPQYFPSQSGMCVCQPRFHTSMLIISDAQALHNLLEPFRANAGNPWGTMVVSDLFVSRRYYDTGCVVYKLLPKHHHPFTPAELDCFDHIFSGTHLNRILACGPENADCSFHTGPHQDARSGEYGKLRGLWKNQEKVFQDLTKRIPLWMLAGKFR